VRALSHRTVALVTSRSLHHGDTTEGSLSIARRVSAAVVDVVSRVVRQTKPRWLVAKGGITSSDLATQALDIRRAWVRGTLAPGIVSVWEPAEGSALRIPLAVFAGNVGTDATLATVVEALQEAA
jgi:uncharacterized protein YgbK (DUF1537 family)